jgi:hypothetical protein
MLSDDALDRMLRDSDPGFDGPAADPRSTAAGQILARVRRRARQRRKRLLAATPAVALAMAGATAATYAWVAGDGHGHTLDSTGLTCVRSDRTDAVVTFDPATEDPVRTCRQQWQDMFGQPAPDTLTACVDSSQQGSIVVYPAGRGTCGRHHADPYTGPTPEQLRLALLRTGLKTQFSERTCIPYPEFTKAISRLLATHDLTGWTSRHSQSADKEPEGPCAEISYYDEPNRTIWLTDHTADTPMNWP